MRRPFWELLLAERELWDSFGSVLASWRWRMGWLALLRDWKWMDFYSRPAMRSISNSIARVVMRHSSLMLMVFAGRGRRCHYGLITDWVRACGFRTVTVLVVKGTAEYGIS